MERIAEPELMNGAEQTAAYAGADFSGPNRLFVELFRSRFPADVRGIILDLGCGPADIPIRLAEAFPFCRVDAVDGAPQMLALGRRAVAARGLVHRVRLIEALLPALALPIGGYEAVVSNSLLHHLADPGLLWQTVRRCGQRGAAVLVMDLMRPADREGARALVARYAAGEPAVLREDFYNSLLAAYRPDEVEAQLEAAGLGSLHVEVVSDRHLAVAGRLPAG